MSTSAGLQTLAGVDLLRGFLRERELSIQEFCERHRHPALERTKVVRVLGGDRTRIAVDFAKAIHEATSGAVPWWTWTSDGAFPSQGSDPTDVAIDRGPDFDQSTQEGA